MDALSRDQHDTPETSDFDRFVELQQQGRNSEAYSVIYDELRRLAAAFMRREGRGHPLQPTALVHEAYCRLIGSPVLSSEQKALFFGAVARAMRNILIEHFRENKACKRGGGRGRVPLADDVAAKRQRTTILALTELLPQLAEKHGSEVLKIVELRYYCGLTIAETAEVLDVSLSTVKRTWVFAKTWLAKHLNDCS